MHEETDNYNVIDDLNETNLLIKKYDRKIKIFGSLYKVSRVLYFLTPLVLFAAIFGVNIFVVLGITAFSILFTGYLSLRFKTLYYINYYALSGFGQYKEKLIGEMSK